MLIMIVVITNIRHKNLIGKAIESVNKSEETIKNNMPIDVVAIFYKRNFREFRKYNRRFCNRRYYK